MPIDLTKLNRIPDGLITQNFNMIVEYLLALPATQATSSTYTNIKSLGAVGDGSHDDAPAFQAAATAGGTYYLPPGTYKLGSQITIPDGVSLSFLGDNFRNVNIITPAGLIGFKYNRVGVGSFLTLQNINFNESGLGKLGMALQWWGAAVGTDDNWLYVNHCEFAGYNHAIDVKFAQNCRYIDIFFQSNNECLFFARDASFQWITRCLAINNGRFLNAQDALNDGISNGIFVTNCTSALGTNEDIFCLGYQLIQLNNSTCDLGGTGATTSMYFQQCDDVRIQGGWVAVTAGAYATRCGLQFNTCHYFSVVGMKFTSCNQGMIVSCTAAADVYGSIAACVFQHSNVNDIMVLGNTRGLTITGCSFFSAGISYTSTNFPIYANVAGNNYITIVGNTFIGAQYQLIAGARATVSPNVFEGSAGADDFLVKYDASGNVTFRIDSNNNVILGTIGAGLQIKKGTNARVGVATLAAGTVTVANTSVTANSVVLLTSQSNGAAPGAVRVSALTAGTSFVISSSSGTDTSTVAWMIVEALP